MLDHDLLANLQIWKDKQTAHYKAHPPKDPDHATLWKKIKEHWDDAVAAPEDLSSRGAAGLMMAVRHSFAKSVSKSNDMRLRLIDDSPPLRLRTGIEPMEFILLVSQYFQAMRKLAARPLDFLRGLIW